jgi:hypothetical protein
MRLIIERPYRLEHSPHRLRQQDASTFRRTKEEKYRCVH